MSYLFSQQQFKRLFNHAHQLSSSGLTDNEVREQMVEVIREENPSISPQLIRETLDQISKAHRNQQGYRSPDEVEMEGDNETVIPSKFLSNAEEKQPFQNTVNTPSLPETDTQSMKNLISMTHNLRVKVNGFENEEKERSGRNLQNISPSHQTHQWPNIAVDSKVKLFPDPKPFTGKRTEYLSWKLDMTNKLWIDAADYATDTAQVVYVFNHLKNESPFLARSHVFAYLKLHPETTIDNLWKFMDNVWARDWRLRH